VLAIDINQGDTDIRTMGLRGDELLVFEVVVSFRGPLDLLLRDSS
jgi:hypothetical protein